MGEEISRGYIYLVVEIMLGERDFGEPLSIRLEY